MAKRKTEEESLRKGNPTRRNSKVAIDLQTLIAAGIARDHKVAQKAEKPEVQPSAIRKIATSHPEPDRFAAGTGRVELLSHPRLSFFQST